MLFVRCFVFFVVVVIVVVVVVVVVAGGTMFDVCIGFWVQLEFFVTDSIECFVLFCMNNVRVGMACCSKGKQLKVMPKKPTRAPCLRYVASFCAFEVKGDYVFCNVAVFGAAGNVL